MRECISSDNDSPFEKAKESEDKLDIEDISIQADENNVSDES